RGPSAGLVRLEAHAVGAALVDELTIALTLFAHTGEGRHVAVLTGGGLPAPLACVIRVSDPLAIGIAQALEALAFSDAEDIRAEEAHVVAAAAELARAQVALGLRRRPRVGDEPGRGHRQALGRRREIEELRRI